MVAPLDIAGTDPAYHKLLNEMKLPQWMFAASSTETGHHELSVKAFYNRLTDSESIPWGVWIKPIFGWGLVAAAFLVAMLSLACLLRFQWAVNERLPFPIAQLQSMLIAPPQKGRAFNDVFSNKGFWLAALFVIVLQSSAALNAYFPESVPKMPFGFNLTNVFSEHPWVYLPGWLKSASIYFTLLGVSYFTQTRVSFSLWGTAILLALIRWPLAIAGTDLTEAAYNDQALGASFAFIAGVLWIGRHHWMVIARAVVGRNRPNEAHGAFVSYRTAAIAFLIGVAGMAAWLMVVGCSWWLTALIVLMILMAHTITARVVAETGLAFVRVHVGMNQLLVATREPMISPREAFVYGAMHYGFMQSARESTLTFAMHGLNVIDDTEPSPRDRKAVIPILSTTLVVAFIACVIASLWCYYTYSLPLDDATAGVLNPAGTRIWPRAFLMDFPTQASKPLWPVLAHSPWKQILIGIVIMITLQMLTWRFSAWPLMPVGYLLCTSWYVTSAWLSLFLGWLAKVLILRFGGSKLFNDLKPVFIGLIFGEALATGIWLIITLVLALNDRELHIQRFLPQ
jgi:hypothetical protein